MERNRRAFSVAARLPRGGGRRGRIRLLPRLKFALALLLSAATAIHALAGAFHGWAAFEWIAVPSAAAALAGLLLLGRWLSRRGFSLSTRAAAPLGLAALTLALIPALDAHRRRTAPAALEESSVYHRTPRAWAPTARVLRETSVPGRIAVTSGPDQYHNHWFLYFLLGARGEPTGCRSLFSGSSDSCPCCDH